MKSERHNYAIESVIYFIEIYSVAFLNRCLCLLMTASPADDALWDLYLVKYCSGAFLPSVWVK